MSLAGPKGLDLRGIGPHHAVNRLIKRIGERAGFPFKVHAHMLRHGCGYALANAGHETRAIQGWLGHRSIQHTVRYTELSPTRFKDFWRD
jgi:site-specific recombinase XerD